MSDSNGITGLRRVPLWKEITVILVIKAVVLYLIWLAFFSAPAARHLDASGMTSALLRPDPHPTPSQQETGHAARPGTR